MAEDRPLQEGDIVELLPGAPLPPRLHVPPGARGRVIMVDPATEPGEWVTVLIGRSGRAIRIQRRWLRRVDE